MIVFLGGIPCHWLCRCSGVVVCEWAHKRLSRLCLAGVYLLQWRGAMLCAYYVHEYRFAICLLIVKQVVEGMCGGEAPLPLSPL
jgi:hypothetical protein